MHDRISYGRRLTDAEYAQRIVALHTGQPPTPSRQQDQQIRRQELELAIDHRLGIDFPSERREQLWAVQQKVEKHRLRYAVKQIFRNMLRRPSDESGAALSNAMFAEYSQVLSAEEMNAYFDR